MRGWLPRRRRKPKRAVVVERQDGYVHVDAWKHAKHLRGQWHARRRWMAAREAKRREAKS